VLAQLTDVSDQAEIDRLAAQGYLFCETPDCRAYGRREDLVETESGELHCPSDAATLDGVAP
jgi:hypothetical protein